MLLRRKAEKLECLAENCDAALIFGYMVEKFYFCNVAKRGSR